MDKLRLKSSMIIYELETSLGDYVIQNEILDKVSEQNKKSVTTRMNLSEEKKGDLAFLVEASYLDEIFNFAIDTTEGSSLCIYMKELKELCTFLGIFDIRNSISHPNRPFPDSYWFKSATIASDPLIQKLGLGRVRQALNMAIEENFSSPPPDEWFEDVKWAIRNTLPKAFDHEITGLLGRDKEFKDLHHTISKARNNLIAVVAPGGTGKTALILQFLKDLSLSPKFNEKIDSIIFCTLKNERLTADGIEEIEAIDGLDQIRSTIFNDLSVLYSDKEFIDFEDACEKLSSEKILICIDNLETLLMHSQKEFIEFNQGLPLYWRLIVTSRVSVDSATTVPLEPLGKRHAINLARNYFKKRGVQTFKQEDLERIAEMANNNPLAIRLTIDLYNKGVDINQSIKKSQQDIASFSYKNLIESLNPISISILEAIYVLGVSTKSELIDFLEISNEEMAECSNELAKTSLLIRSTNEIGIDSYKLSDSIRDLLLMNPKNIEVRAKISDSLKKTKSKILEQTKRNQQLGLNEFDGTFVDPETDRSINALIVDLNKYIFKSKSMRNHDDLIEIRSKFNDLLTYNSNDYELNFHYSRILKELKDKPGELAILEKVLKLKPNNPRTLHAKGMYNFYNTALTFLGA